MRDGDTLITKLRHGGGLCADVRSGHGATAVAVVGSNQLALSPILLDVARSLAASPVAVSRAAACYGGATTLSALLLAPRIDRLGARLLA